jgi:hypothetical protein
MNYFNQRAPRVECYLTIKRNRIKKYGDSFFLKPNQEFELELFNPHQKSVLLKISFNGQEISLGGIILRPGERIYLERYLESDRKFKFETYEVDGSEESKKAVALNGLVNIKSYFKKDFDSQWWNYSHNSTGGNIFNGLPSSYNTYYSDFTFNSNTSTPKAFFASSFFNNDKRSLSTETGIIGEGNKSDQKFEISNEKFSPFYSEEIDFKILPESQKAISGTDIRKYCTSCGTRIKSAGWKFCPACGKAAE